MPLNIYFILIFKIFSFIYKACPTKHYNMDKQHTIMNEQQYAQSQEVCGFHQLFYHCVFLMNYFFLDAQ